VRVERPEESVVNLADRTTPLIHPLTTTFAVVVFLAFMPVGREDLRDRGIHLAGRGRMHVATSAIEDASRRVGRYLRMQLISSLALSFRAPGKDVWPEAPGSCSRLARASRESNYAGGGCDPISPVTWQHSLRGVYVRAVSNLMPVPIASCREAFSSAEQSMTGFTPVNATGSYAWL
jgi:hypothetical protein